MENWHDNGVVSLGGAGELHHTWRVVDLLDVSKTVVASEGRY